MINRIKIMSSGTIKIDSNKMIGRQIRIVKKMMKKKGNQ